MAIPDYQSLMLPVLTLAAKGEIRVPEAARIIADQLGLSDEEREEMLPSGRQRVLHNRIHWAKFYMTKAGLIDSPRRGTFVASPSGFELLANQPARIDVEALKRIPAFQDYYRHFTKDVIQSVENEAFAASSPSGITPEEQIELRTHC